MITTILVVIIDENTLLETFEGDETDQKLPARVAILFMSRR